MNKNAVDLSEETKECCVAWPLLRRRFSWVKAIFGTHTRYIMPSIPDRDTGWRVRFCPSCGADRLNVMERFVE